MKNKLNGESNESSKNKDSSEITTNTDDKISIDTRTDDKSENNENAETKSNESKTDGKSGDKVSAQPNNKTESTTS